MFPVAMCYLLDLQVFRIESSNANLDFDDDNDEDEDEDES